MKINLKTLSLVVVLGTIYYFLSHKKENKQVILEETKPIPGLIDKKPLKSTAPKPYILSQPQNGLGIGNNWRSK